ncbi:5-(carboxyamino)imidazole ribonucleotide synthase [Neobacillus sp. PS3-34]|uniref:5-(carboxyamino)imidazole ribonucleotide synthase n=1 Tax=Neobacillus sp. PS3-34 TaxID=3070678 RepID=UPI0027E051A8|nr:5-(carboxyamino)imidazole ribonucleotide synthase [Neobacillus sp. PS3-34]WML50528.1 5-(carboxyamino)imidazole ribonucleotide synthase [Neobacillus sp. PS3-34]
MSLSEKVILPGQTIGIIGGGELGRMMALAARAMGFRIAVLDPQPDSPCGQVADYPIIGDYNDLDAIRQLADFSDVITYEFENIDAKALQWLCENAYVPQGKDILEITQDRIKEKAAIQQAGLEVVPFEIVENGENLIGKIQALGGYPAVLKTTRGGYDGKGQSVLKSDEDLAAASKLLSQGQCVLEKWLSFEKEISVIVTRKANGEISVFPAAENIHKENILFKTIVPALISDSIEEEAVRMACGLADTINLIGTVAVEMFVTDTGKIFINELAPRPHNSGHYTIDACATSQFEQHIRAICNWTLGGTELLQPAVMVNVLGEHMEMLIEELPTPSDWKIHLYGKGEARTKRKMGHITIVGKSVENALNEIDESPVWAERKTAAGKVN